MFGTPLDADETVQAFVFALCALKWELQSRTGYTAHSPRPKTTDEINAFLAAMPHTLAKMDPSLASRVAEGMMGFHELPSDVKQIPRIGTCLAKNIKEMSAEVTRLEDCGVFAYDHCTFLWKNLFIYYGLQGWRHGQDQRWLHTFV